MNYIKFEKLSLRLHPSRLIREQRGSVTTLQMADKMLNIAETCDQVSEPKYDKAYIGLKRKGLPFDFLTLRPRKGSLVLEAELSKIDDIVYRLPLRQVGPTERAPLEQLINAACRYQAA